MSDILDVNCWVLGRHPHCVFSVEIAKTKTIYALKKAIKDENQHSFDGVDAGDLDLWKVKINVSTHEDCDVLKTIKVDSDIQGREMLRPLDKVCEALTDIPSEYLHIIVRHQVPKSRSYGWQSMRRGRKEWLKQFSDRPPWKAAQATEFMVDQAREKPAFYFSRPPSAAATIPITLYHTVFGQFQDDCDQYIPTKADHDFVLNFSSSMSRLYDPEDDLAARIRKNLRTYGLDFSTDEDIGASDFATDGDLRWRGLAYAILGLPDSEGAEPLFKAGWDYATFMSEPSNNINANLPCFIIYVVGAHVGFAGAVWTDRPHLQVLSPTVPLFYHSTDVKIRMTTARYFGAAKKAIFALRHYYEHELGAIDTLDPHTGLTPFFPYPNQYYSILDFTTHAFKYIAPYRGLVFVGRDDDGRMACIKFVRQYSKEAHLKCSSLGFAPALRGFELIPGGWYMVVMDYIDDTHQELEESCTKASYATEVREKVGSLHQAGFVHGDVRSANIMVKKDGRPGILLIDFDWAGVIGDIRYPMNVNREGVSRPDGAYDGELITTDHDIDMVDIMFRGL